MKRLNLLLPALLLCSTMLRADELQTVTPEQLLDMQKNQNALIVDIRTEAEWQASGLIAGSHKLQAFDSEGRFEPEHWTSRLESLKTHPDQPVILVCRSGNRSGKAGQVLTGQRGMKNVYHLSNGLKAWQQTHPLIPNCASAACK
ncbi:MAG: rhodanese-like domain-containing protein [Methylomonas sp.]|nr:rhodanese-like domain-containing protein [Methylomonas sp.]PPD21553.1 MAG: rhodanese [Methylomonas sp.]PPD24935.1 MAG: rhodanese [Methylomonas sp.]PPD34100.1 MAG: rhodanese [Methylomonas sp.]PPD40490.1 MAG: rhodanese [Methylomonas sp.]